MILSCSVFLVSTTSSLVDIDVLKVPSSLFKQGINFNSQ